MTDPAARLWQLDVTSTNPTNQEFINRAAFNHHPAHRSSPAQCGWRAASAPSLYNAICAATGTTFHPFALETTGGHQGFHFAKRMRDLGMPADALAGNF